VNDRIAHWLRELRGTHLTTTAAGKFCKRCLDAAQSCPEAYTAELYLEAAIVTVGWLDGAAADAETRPLAEKIPPRAAELHRDATMLDAATETQEAR
jgi:hypothetical protein